MARKRVLVSAILSVTAFAVGYGGVTPLEIDSVFLVMIPKICQLTLQGRPGDPICPGSNWIWLKSWNTCRYPMMRGQRF